MRRVVRIVAVLTGLLVAGFLFFMPMFMPIPGNFAGYLWWRYTADPHPQTGSVDTDGASIHYQHYPGQCPAILLLRASRVKSQQGLAL